MLARKMETTLENAVLTKDGLKYNGFFLKPVVEQCEGCERILEHESGQYCASCPNPDQKWSRKACNFATHTRGNGPKIEKAKVNPLKASKRAAKKGR